MQVIRSFKYEGCSEINETLAINKLFKKLQFSFLVDMQQMIFVDGVQVI